jgi:hypothetical protein
LGNLSTPKSVQKLQKALHAKAKAEIGYRFYALYDKISREDILSHTYAQCRSNKGAPGVDGQDFADIDAYGVQRWLGELALALRQDAGGGVRDRAAAFNPACEQQGGDRRGVSCDGAKARPGAGDHHRCAVRQPSRSVGNAGGALSDSCDLGEGAHKAMFGTDFVSACSYFLLKPGAANRLLLRSLDSFDHSVSVAMRLAERSGALAGARRILRW